MKFFYSRSVSSIKSSDGIKKKSFKIIKGKNNAIEEIKGITTNQNSDVFDINHEIKKKNIKTGKIYSKHRSFKLKSSDILNLFKESTEYKNINLKKDNKVKELNNKNLEKLENKIKEKKLITGIVKKDIEKVKNQVKPLEKVKIPVKTPVKKDIVEKDKKLVKTPVKKDKKSVKTSVKKDKKSVKTPVKKDKIPVKPSIKKDTEKVKIPLKTSIKNSKK